MYKIYNFDMSKIEIYNYSKPSFGLNYNEFTAYCRTQKQIILDDYFFRKLNEFYIYANKGFYVDEVIENNIINWFIVILLKIMIVTML